MSRVATRSPPPRSRSRVAVRDEEIDVRVRERDTNRTPAFLREDARRTEAGPMVLRQRDVETVDRHRRSPSPVRYREERLVRRPKSVSPPPMREEHEHLRFVERERVRSPSVVRRRSPSPIPVRFVERPRRSPSPPAREHIHTRIVERERERMPSPSPSPPPPPPVIRGPTVEREVITHYTDIDHGMPSAIQMTDHAADRVFKESCEQNGRAHHHHHRRRPDRVRGSARRTSTSRCPRTAPRWTFIAPAAGLAQGAENVGRITTTMTSTSSSVGTTISALMSAPSGTAGRTRLRRSGRPWTKNPITSPVKWTLVAAWARPGAVQPRIGPS